MLNFQSNFEYLFPFFPASFKKRTTHYKFFNEITFVFERSHCVNHFGFYWPLTRALSDCVAIFGWTIVSKSDHNVEEKVKNQKQVREKIYFNATVVFVTNFSLYFVLCMHLHWKNTNSTLLDSQIFYSVFVDLMHRDMKHLFQWGKFRLCRNLKQYQLDLISIEVLNY